jgi:hypothetical protein
METALNGVVETIISNVTSWSFIAYILANVVLFLIVKYYGLRDIRRGNKDPNCL